MLQRIRDRISGWIAGVIIALVASAFILFGIEYYFEQGSGGQENVAVVNGVSITSRQFDELYSQVQQQTISEMGGAPLTDAIKQQIKSYALQSVITQTALKTILKRDGFRIGMSQIKAMVESAPQFQTKGKFSEAKLMQTMYQMGVSPQEFFDNLQTRWLTNEVMSGISNSAFALPNEVAHQYALLHQERAFGYFIVPSHSFLSSAKITDQDIKNAYAAAQSTYQTPAKVSVAYIELSPSAMEKNITITPAEAKAYYDAHRANYQLPARFEVSQMTVPVAATASSADIQKAELQAKTIVADMEHGKNSGMQGQVITLTATELDPALRATLSNLQVGKTAQPLRTANGFTVLTLLKVEPPKADSFDSVQKTIVELLLHQRVNQVLSEQSNQLSDLTYTNPTSLEVASKALNLPIQTTQMMTKSGEAAGLFANPKVLAAVFSESVFEAGNNSGPIDLKDGTQIVLRVAKKEPSEPIPLATVSAQIKMQLAQKQAVAQAGLLAYQLQKKLESGANPATIAKKNNLKWHAVPLMSQAEKSTTPQPIIAAAFSQKPKEAQALLYDAQNYAVIAVLQVKNPGVAADGADEKQLSTQLSTLWGQLLQHYFVDSVTTDSKIKVVNSAPTA